MEEIVTTGLSLPAGMRTLLQSADRSVILQQIDTVLAQTEQAVDICANLEILYFLLDSVSISDDSSKIQSIFFSLGKITGVSSDPDVAVTASNPHVVHLSTSAIGKLYAHIPSSNQIAFLQKCVACFEKHCTDDHEHTTQLLTTINILSLLAKQDANGNDGEKHKLYKKLSDLIVNSLSLPEQIVGHISAQLMGSLFKMQCLVSEDLWKVITSIHTEHGQHEYNSKSVDQLSERSFFLLCGTADWFFPISGFDHFSLSLLKSRTFWEFLQTGFWHIGTLTRKRSMYLLKRILDICSTSKIDIEQSADGLFSWDSKQTSAMMKVWEDFILLTETLEEKQVHVIKQVMPRLNKLVQATYSKQSGWSLHTSWVCTVLQRVMSHESTYIQRWGIQQLIDIDLVKCPILTQQMEFFLGPFVSMLSESTLYHKPTEIPLGECSPLVKSLHMFFKSCQQNLSPPQQGVFFTGFLHSLCRVFWSGAALVYVVESLTFVPSCPAWDRSCVASIRELMTSGVRTMETHFRGAIQCFLIQAAINLMDVSLLSIPDLLQLVSVLRYDETLRRGTSLWRDITQWFRTVCDGRHDKDCSVASYVQTAIQQMLSAKNMTGSTEQTSEQSDTSITRLLLLCADAGYLPQKTSLPAETSFEAAISPIMDILHTMNSHAYMPAEKADTAMAIMATIMKESKPVDGSDWLCSTIKQCVGQCAGEMITFIHRRVAQFEKVFEIEKGEFYADLLETIHKEEVCDVTILPQTSVLVDFCLKILNTEQPQPTLSHQVRRYSCMRFMAALLSMSHTPQSPWQHKVVEYLSTMNKEPDFAKPVDLENENSESINISQSSSAFGGHVSWGKLASSYLAVQWGALCTYLQHHSSASSLPEPLFQQLQPLCLSVMDLVSGLHLIPVFRAAKILLPQCPPSLVVPVLSLAWGRVKEASKASTYWDTFEAFIDLAYQPCVLEAKPDSDVGECLSQINTELFAFGEEKRGLVVTALQRVIAWWLQAPENVAKSLHHAPLLVQALLYGDIHSKGKRYFYEVHMYLLGLGDSLAVNELCDTSSKDDIMVRVNALSFLTLLRPDIEEHRCFAEEIVSLLIQEHRGLQNLKSFRNFPNSLPHRHKHRIVCALLLLEQFGHPDSESFHDYLLEMLCTENQTSVRCMIEWMMIRLYYQEPVLHYQLWESMKQSATKKPVFVCSLLTIIAHLAKLITDTQQQVSFMLRAIPGVVSWCMSHHFNTRTFAQATLVSLWQQATEHGLSSVLQQHSSVQTFMDMWIHSPHCVKTTQKLLDNFFFSFHALRDYTIETIVRTLPYLTQMSDEEWLPLVAFDKVYASWGTTGGHYVPLKNPSQELQHSKPGTWKVKYTETESSENGDSQEGDVQKKIIPWSSMLPSESLEPELLDDYEKKQKSGGLILVTSLINKVPNLGGLCRSSEIFGVSEFVVGNLQYVKDKQFENLSVTAHKWIPIKEVAPHLLVKYLLEMKQEGYTLVGAEQTANSHCLTQYTFPQKTLLLLGNEKEGIPVDLIQLLDVCVEIPQQGVIRSLNVHVCGALLIWEYTRQQLMSGGNSADLTGKSG